ncbi:pilus assembly protein PilI, partial [Escherichia coli]|nr:pilus assembly protein PilI [Escherichia coli]
MVCIIQDGNRILRWDRSYASHTKNHWRKAAPDSFEILGTIENLHYVGKQD